MAVIPVAEIRDESRFRKAPSATTADPSSHPTGTRSPNDAAHKATVAIARKVLTLVYCGLRDGEIRCLANTA